MALSVGGCCCTPVRCRVRREAGETGLQHRLDSPSLAPGVPAPHGQGFRDAARPRGRRRRGDRRLGRACLGHGVRLRSRDRQVREDAGCKAACMASGTVERLSVMSLLTFFAGILIGAAVVAVLLAPRLRASVESARAAGVELRLAAERVSAHERQLEELRAATAEKIALVAGNREQLAEQMKAISADTTRQVSEQLERLAAAQREADRATAAGELGKRTEEIKRSLDPIAQHLTRMSGQVEQLDRDRHTTHGQVRQMFESMSSE